MCHHLDELRLIPIADKSQIKIHNAIGLLLVFFESSGATALIAECHGHCISGVLGSFHCDKDSGAEHGINEAGGVSGEEPAVPSKAAVAIRVVTLGQNL